jgi:hypothetical protein
MLNAAISEGAPPWRICSQHPAPPCLGETLRRGILNYSIIPGTTPHNHSTFYEIFRIGRLQSKKLKNKLYTLNGVRYVLS